MSRLSGEPFRAAPDAALALLGGAVGLPIVLLLMPRLPRPQPVTRGPVSLKGDWSFLRTRDFWLLSFANVAASIATNGAISQMAPMVVEHGLSPATAALALSAFAAGQFIGKLGGGWLLDRFEPRRVAALMTVVPSLGFVVFLQADPGMATMVLVACGMIGALSGAEIDIFAYFAARRFGLASYGAAFGGLIAFGWIGTASGITLFSQIAHASGSYALAQALSIGLLGIAALFFLPVRLAAVEEPGGGPGGSIAGALVGDAKPGQA